LNSLQVRYFQKSWTLEEDENPKKEIEKISSSGGKTKKQEKFLLKKHANFVFYFLKNF